MYRICPYSSWAQLEARARLEAQAKIEARDLSSDCWISSRGQVQIDAPGPESTHWHSSLSEVHAFKCESNAVQQVVTD